MYALLFGWICVCISAGVQSELLDLVTVYRIDDSETMAIKEFHKMTNTPGFVLRAKNYALIDSMSGMNSFKFNPSDTLSYKNGTWKMELQDISGEEHFTIVTDEEEPFGHNGRNCAVNNGGCRVLCDRDTSRYTSDYICKCPSGFHLNTTTTSCYGDGAVSEVHENFSGSETGLLQHLIIAPPNHTIRVIVTVESSDCQVDVNEYRASTFRLGAVSYYSTRTFDSTSNILELASRNRYRRSWRFTYAVRRPLLTLASASGELAINIHPTSLHLCLTVVSKTAMNASQIFVVTKPNEVQILGSRIKKIGSWNLDIFEMPLETRDPLTLSVIVSGTATVIHSIFECSKGDLEVIPIRRVPTSSLPSVEKPSDLNKVDEVCQIRGIYDLESGACNCVPGFTGTSCEQACGPNRYGNDCKVRCSMFDKECSRIIFCKTGLPCFCAPGYKGKLCSSQCSDGFYGASCQSSCGKCRSRKCDIYTGECNEGCLPGFYPPLCQETYKYSAEAPTVFFKSFNSVSLTLNNTATKGRGIINRYQVQCREMSTHQGWLEYQPQVYPSEISTANVFLTANVSVLNPGTTYEARIVFYSEDGNSYQDDNAVPKVIFSTLCEMPESREYNLNIEDVSSTYLAISWKPFVEKENSCSIVGYEITFRKDWEKVVKNVSSESNNEEFFGLLPGEKYTVEVQTLTSFGRAPISHPLDVETLGRAPQRVRNLRVIPLDDTKLSVSWNQPTIIDGNITEYVMIYECTKHLSSEYCGCNFHHQLNTTQTSIELVGLDPFTQYIIKVAGKVESLGPYSFAYGATKEAAPNVAPEASSTPVVSRMNSSFAVEWLPPSDCKALNGFLAGYHFELQSSNGHTLLHGNTSDTSASFNNLTPQTSYQVQIFVMTAAGWNKSHPLNINVTTAASVPEAVQHVIVYKRARRMLGLRWAAPKETYGEIKSFTISYRHGNSKEITERVLPLKCVPWPDYFCHTIQNLIPNKKYTVTVGARNEHIDADGDLTNITSVSVEGAPESPESLTLVERTSTTVSLQWSPPFMFNGILRSFVINVEQIDAANSSDCCDYYPVQEVPVKEEQQYYYFQATNLKPASKYSIGVSSKTLTIGSSSNLTVNTHPVKPELQPPVFTESGLVQLPPPFEYPGVDSTYFLLVLPSFEISSPEIHDAEVMALLHEAVNASFYIVKELQYEDLVEEPEVELGTGAESREGLFGLLQDPALDPGTYSVGLAVLLDYGGAKTVGFAASEPFSIE